MADLRYVDVEGRVTIEFVKDLEPGVDALKLEFVDKIFQKQGLEPIYLFLKNDPSTGEIRPIRFKHVSFTAEFNETGFARVAGTLNQIDPFIGQWADLEASNGNGRMNPSGPPST